MDRFNSGIIVVIVVSIMLFFLNSFLYQHNLEHENPYGYFVSDSFAYLFLSDYVKEVGSAKYAPSYESWGYDDVLMIHPPIFYSVVAIFSTLSGLEVYDALNFIAALLIALISGIFFYMIYDFNPSVALISVGLFGFFFVNKFQTIYTWGQYGAVIGLFFAVSILWYFWRIHLTKSLFIGVILFSGGILSHIPEVVFVMFFFLFWFVYSYFKDSQLSFELFIKTSLSFIMALFVCFYYIWIFKNTFLVFQGRGEAYLNPEDITGLPVPLFNDFGYFFMGFIILGFLISLYYLFIKKAHFILLAGMFFFVLGFSNYYGLGYRSIHVRDLWPVFASVLFGFGVYSLIKLFLRKHVLLISSIIGISFFAGIIWQFDFEPNTNQGCMDKMHWEVVEYVKQNTSKDARFFVFFGDCYSQSARVFPRAMFYINVNDFINSLRQNKISRNYSSEWMTLYDSHLVYKKGLFSLGFHKEEDNINFTLPSTDMCSFDYFIIDSVSYAIPKLGEVNKLILNMLLKGGSEIVFSNSVVSVIRNNNVRGDCVVV